MSEEELKYRCDECGCECKLKMKDDGYPNVPYICPINGATVQFNKFIDISQPDVKEKTNE